MLPKSALHFYIYTLSIHSSTTKTPSHTRNAIQLYPTTAAMRYLSTVALLATLTSGILAQNVGTFEAFPVPDCSVAGQEIAVEHPEATGLIVPPALSVRSNLADCRRKCLS